MMQVQRACHTLTRFYECFGIGNEISLQLCNYPKTPSRETDHSALYT